MKQSLLLLLTLSSALCYGQGRKDLWVTDTLDRNPNDFYDTLRWDGHSTLFERKLSLEEKLLLYAEECWNDSTAQSIHGNGRGWSNDIHVLYCTTKDFPDHWKYTHRKPTFEGFIEWLKKK